MIFSQFMRGIYKWCPEEAHNYNIKPHHTASCRFISLANTANYSLFPLQPA